MLLNYVLLVLHMLLSCHATPAEEESVNAELLGGVFGGVVSVVVLLSLVATLIAWYLSRQVEPAL